MQGGATVWRADDGSTGFEAPAAMLEAIRSEASVAMLGMGQGGIEIGGLLLGARDGRRVAVRDWRPIRCDHSLGASFQLSQRDMAVLSSQIDGISAESGISGNSVVGWFVSHTRGELDLRDEEKRLHQRAMPEDVGLLLVLKPNQFGDVEVLFNHMHGEEASAAPGSLHLTPKPDLHWTPDAVKVPDGEPEVLRSATPYVASLGLLILLGACGWLGWDLWERFGPAIMALSGTAKANEPSAPPTPVQSLSLHVRRVPGAYDILWNPQSDAIGAAASASLTIYDNTGIQTHPLNAAVLKSGRFNYRAAVPTVTVKLVVEGSEGQRRVERVTYPSMNVLSERQ